MAGYRLLNHNYAKHTRQKLPTTDINTKARDYHTSWKISEE